MNIIKDFIESAPQGEKVLTVDELPYRIPLIMNNVRLLEGAKYTSYIMSAQFAVQVKKQAGKWVFLQEFRKKYNIDDAYEELERQVKEQMQKDSKMVIPQGGQSHAVRKSNFSFFLPKRMGDVCADPKYGEKALEQINSQTMLGVFVGKKNTSMCLVLVPLKNQQQLKRKNEREGASSSGNSKKSKKLAPTTVVEEPIEHEENEVVELGDEEEEEEECAADQGEPFQEESSSDDEA